MAGEPSHGEAVNVLAEAEASDCEQHFRREIGSKIKLNVCGVHGRSFDAIFRQEGRVPVAIRRKSLVISSLRE